MIDIVRIYHEFLFVLNYIQNYVTTYASCLHDYSRLAVKDNNGKCNIKMI